MDRQSGSFQPRCCLNAANDDNTVTQPWMYEENNEYIRAAYALDVYKRQAENNVTALRDHADVTKYYCFDEHTRIPDILLLSLIHIFPGPVRQAAQIIVVVGGLHHGVVNDLSLIHI